MAKPNLSEIQEQIKKLQEQADKLIAEQKDSVIAEIKKQIEEFGLTAQDLGFSTVTKPKKAKSATAPKTVAYRNEKGETWSGGRGPKPQWIKDVISKEGINGIEKYKVSSE